MISESDKKILIDCDVLIHLNKGDKLSLLSELYKDRIILLDIIKDEFTRIGKHPHMFNILLIQAGIEEIVFPTDKEELLNEFIELNSHFGAGESACMAYAKFHNNIIASSNLKDIKDYCTKNKITYITTMDIIEEAYTKKIMVLEECDLFITKVINSKSKLPFNDMTKYLQSKKL
ncbi:MAG: hypothetical protein JXR64_07025 [Spirochaetales bacterium]|nr:hypothetical protein [Spirochaetales bacterium]